MKILAALICTYFLLVPRCSMAQVINDNIENRTHLSVNEPARSTTNNCTVQWDCVDESLTGKCIDYHNDQWFTFNAGSKTRLYINISHQKCRDLRGIQIVALKGEPCNTSSYHILTCVSLANQDDIYVTLDSLQQGQNYLVNIDGYLHDFCSFQIEVSDKAKGLPIDDSLPLETFSSQQDHLVRIEWVLPDSLKRQVYHFKIFRRIEPAYKVSMHSEVPVEVNAFGVIKSNYIFEDSIAPDKMCEYKLAAELENDRLVLIDTYKFEHSYSPKSLIYKRNLQIPLGNVKKKQSITVIISDPASGRVLDHEVFTYQKKQPKYIYYKTGKALQLDAEKLLVKVVNNSTKITQEYIYDLWIER